MIRRNFAGLGIALLLAACGSPTEPDSTPTIEGPIVARNVEMATVTAPSIHVKESAAAECGIVFSVRQAEIIRQVENGKDAEGSVDDLWIGRNVRVWAREVVLQSCPAQASAKLVLILRYERRQTGIAPNCRIGRGRWPWNGRGLSR